MGPGDLFAAFVGDNTDGHRFVGDAFRRGAQAVICEERGREAAVAAGATIVNCRADRAAPAGSAWATAPANAMAGQALAYIVDSSVDGLQRVGGFQRMHRANPALSVIGVTGSVGKTSTKELVYAVLKQRYVTLHSKGNLNSDQGLPLSLLELDASYERAVLEMGMYGLGEIAAMCVLARPRIGVMTNVGPVHLSRLGSLDNIRQAKSELVQALPAAEDGGVAVLNWDDERVKAMADLTRARVFRYGLTPEADLWATEISSAGMEGIRFRFHYRPSEGGKVESLYVRVPLLGRHSVHTALRAAAVGLVEGLGWEEIVAGMQSLPGQIRLVAVKGINGSTVIDDTYNASPQSVIAALNLLNDLAPQPGGRRVAVLGDMRELGDETEEGHRMVGVRAADVVHLLVTVGDLGHTIGDEARAAGFSADCLHHADTAEEAISFLQQAIRSGDLVLVKGSRAVGMERIVPAISQDDRAAAPRSTH
jgi:UDP-N-acetylmuramoyl-tripeptide--D-alanyl-D-alanine ligase